MDNQELHMLGDFSPMHDIGHAVVDSWVDDAKQFAHDHPRITAGLAGAGALGTAVALAPELTLAGVGAGAGELATMAGYGNAVMDATNYARLGATGAALMGLV